jgi:mannose-1-phosphate guanylyltransferase
MYGVILAGGGGTRLWPLSRARLPKPLMPLLPDGSTMLQATAARLRPLTPPDRLFVATGAAYADEIRRQLPDLPPDHLIVEPSARDTAPAIGLAATHIARRDPGAVMGVFPADHIIRDEEGLRANLRLAERVAEAGHLVTLGMQPAYPETGYGYIEAGEPLPGLDGARAVARFVEKPDLPTATRYVEGGRHLWNAGIFVWRAGVILEQFREFLPDSAAPLARIGDALGTPRANEVLAAAWPDLRRISVDFGIMEPASRAAPPRVATIPSDVGWSDAGDWNAVGTLLGQPGAGFVAAGIEHLALESRDCVVSAPAGKLVATIGLEDLVIIDTPGALLVCPRARAQEVKRVVDLLKQRGRDDIL